MPMQWANGDKLARSPVEVAASERNYVLAFEMLAEMRNWMFFNATHLTDDLWAGEALPFSLPHFSAAVQ